MVVHGDREWEQVIHVVEVGCRGGGVTVVAVVVRRNREECGV